MKDLKQAGDRLQDHMKDLDKLGRDRRQADMLTIEEDWAIEREKLKVDQLIIKVNRWTRAAWNAEISAVRKEYEDEAGEESERGRSRYRRVQVNFEEEL